MEGFGQGPRSSPAPSAPLPTAVTTASSSTTRPASQTPSRQTVLAVGSRYPYRAGHAGAVVLPWLAFMPTMPGVARPCQCMGRSWLAAWSPGRFSSSGNGRTSGRRRSWQTGRGPGKTSLCRMSARISNELLILVARPGAAALSTRDGLALISAKDNFNTAAAVDAERIKIGPLAGKRRRVVPHQSGEVADRNYVIAGSWSCRRLGRPAAQL
jgi:hypothetical protein